MANLQALQRQGWYLSSEGVAACMESPNVTTEKVIEVALNSDLKDIGEKHLPDGITKKSVDSVDGPFVLQIQKIRNVSAPKENEESQAAPPLFKVTLTDGHNQCIAIENEKIPNLGLNTAPGTKLKLLGKVPVEHGFLLLKKANAKVLGGRVDKLAENWELKKSLASQGRTTGGGAAGGPPEFIPFGQKRRDEPNVPTRGGKTGASPVGNFRSLENKEKKEKEENKEFQQAREATIAEVQKAKEGGGAQQRIKSLVGSKQDDKDQKVAQIMEMGFSADQAATALRQHPASVQDAINSLLSGQTTGDFRGAHAPRGGGGGMGGGGRGGGGRQARANGDSAHTADSGREHRDSGGGGGGRDHREGGRERGSGRRGGRGGRGGGGEEHGEDEDGFQGRPSAAPTLFDFVTSKMPAKQSAAANKGSESRSGKDERRSDNTRGSHHHNTTSSSSTHPHHHNNPTATHHPHHPSNTQHHSQYPDSASSVTSSTGGRRSISEDDNERRSGGPPNLPPRLQKLQDEKAKQLNVGRGGGGAVGGGQGGGGAGGRRNNNGEWGGPGGYNQGMGGGGGRGYDRGPPPNRGYDRGPRGYGGAPGGGGYNMDYHQQDPRAPRRGYHDNRYQGDQNRGYHGGYNQDFPPQQQHQQQRGYNRGPNRYDQRNQGNQQNQNRYQQNQQQQQNRGGGGGGAVYQNGENQQQQQAQQPPMHIPPPLMQQHIPPPSQAIISSDAPPPWAIQQEQQQEQQSQQDAMDSDPAIQGIGLAEEEVVASIDTKAMQDSDAASSMDVYGSSVDLSAVSTPQQTPLQTPYSSAGSGEEYTTTITSQPQDLNAQYPVVSSQGYVMATSQPQQMYIPVTGSNGVQHLIQAGPQQMQAAALMHQLQGMQIGAPPHMPPQMYAQYAPPMQAPQAVSIDGGKRIISTGDYCNAKYYADGEFYRAFVNSIEPQSESLFVTFMDYGNTERVSYNDIKDIKIMPKQWEGGADTMVTADGSIQANSMPGIMIQPPPQMAFLSAFPPGEMYNQQGQYAPVSVATSTADQQYMNQMMAVSSQHQILQQHHMQQQMQQQQQ